MPTNRNALIRYKTIDKCLRNRLKKWTLDMLMDEVSDALYEYEGIDKGISRRTVQADIQMMRSDKLGYNAPIIVTDRKFYTYEDPEYSITNIALSKNDLEQMNEAVEVLKQFKGFTHFNVLNEVVQKLEDHVYTAAHNTEPVIDFEKNEQLKGLEHLDAIYNAVISKKVLKVTYQSFKAKKPATFSYHVWWLKEFKNRWFAVGVKEDSSTILTLALDRMHEVSVDKKTKYINSGKTTSTNFYKDVIGVTVNPNNRFRNVTLFVSNKHAPYVETKPLHHSQKVMHREAHGIIIKIQVQHNYELEKEILSFGEGMVVLGPKKLRDRITQRLKQLKKAYEEKGVC